MSSRDLYIALEWSKEYSVELYHRLKEIYISLHRGDDQEFNIGPIRNRQSSIIDAFIEMLDMRSHQDCLETIMTDVQSPVSVCGGFQCFQGRTIKSPRMPNPIAAIRLAGWNPLSSNTR